jgi:hypothetical protein
MNVTHEPLLKLTVHPTKPHEALTHALRNIARHVEIAVGGDAYDKAMAFVDIEYEVRNALATVGEPV